MKTKLRRISAVFLFGVTALAALVAEAATPSPLDTIFTGAKALGSTNWNEKANAIVQWKAMVDRFKQQQAECQPTDGCVKFKQLVEGLSGLPTLDQIKRVSAAANRIPYKTDFLNYDKADFWATPYEMLSKGAGDAEDYAILDYYALRAAGMPAEAMRVIAIRIPNQGGAASAILAVDTSPEPLVLDNRLAPPIKASLVAKEFTPELGLNEDGWWIYVKAQQ